MTRSRSTSRSWSRPLAGGALALACGLGVLQGLPAANAAPAPGAPSAAAVTSDSTASAVTAARKGKKKAFVPKVGPLFNSPYDRSGRVINDRIYKTIRNTPKGETIKILVWNVDEGGIVNALLGAKKRGVTVQIITSHTTDNPNWYRLAKGLNQGKKNASFAKRCKGACRSYGPTTHSKVIMVSRIRQTRNIVMVGSFNLTYAAATNQWNDLMTFHDAALYNNLSGIFAESRRDKPVKRPYRQTQIGQTQVTVFPAPGLNPVRQLFAPVQCTGAAAGYGNNGRTVIRIAIAGWFQAYGDKIAQRVRQLWDQGCDIRIVTTLAGGGINKRLKATSGRGPVPIKLLSVDPDGDGVPNQYLHLKAVSINGVYNGNPASSIAYTGSHNWSSESRNADEINFRIEGRKGVMMKYQNQINRLFASRKAHYYRELTPSQRRGMLDYDNPNSEFELN